MIKAVIFDCYGVLVEDSWLAFLHKYAGGPNDEQLHYLGTQRDLGRIAINNFYKRVGHLTNMDAIQAKNIISPAHQLNDALVDYIRLLKPNYKIGMISNIGGPINRTLPKAVTSLFDNMTLSYEVGAIKPDPAIYLWALNKLGVTAKEAVFIDDRQYNCDGALAIGMQAIVYQNPRQTIKDLENLGIELGQ